MTSDGLITREIDDSVKARIRELLLEGGKSLRRVANETGVSHEYVRRIRQALEVEGVTLPLPMHAMSKNRNVSRVPLDAFKRLVAEGKDVQEIMSALGIAKRTVYRIATDNGLTVKGTRPVPSPEDLAKVVDLYNGGKSMFEIGAMFGIMPNRIRRLLLDNSVTIRSKVPKRTAAEKKIVALHKEGLGVFAIAAMVKDTETNVYEVLRSARVLGPRKSRREISEADKDLMCSEYEAGKSMAEIARGLKTSTTSVYWWLLRRGVKTRPRGRTAA